MFWLVYLKKHFLTLMNRLVGGWIKNILIFSSVCWVRYGRWRPGCCNVSSKDQIPSQWSRHLIALLSPRRLWNLKPNQSQFWFAFSRPTAVGSNEESQSGQTVCFGSSTSWGSWQRIQSESAAIGCVFGCRCMSFSRCVIHVASSLFLTCLVYYIILY
jgi:hypothetical protein